MKSLSEEWCSQMVLSEGLELLSVTGGRERCMLQANRSRGRVGWKSPGNDEKLHWLKYRRCSWQVGWG